MSRKKFPNYNTTSNNFGLNNDNDNDNNNSLSDYIYSKKKIIKYTILLFLLTFFIFIFSISNLVDKKHNAKSEDFLPARTHNLTLLSKLSSKIRHEKNLIFIGDVHGSLDELKLLIKSLNYNPEVDHLIFVGDLIVKGPKSIEVLKYIKELDVSSVRGNHEDKVLRWRQLLDDLKVGNDDDGEEEKEEDEEIVDLRLKKYFKEKNMRVDDDVFKSEHKILAMKLNKELHKYLLSFPIILNFPNLDLYVVHGGLLPGESLVSQEPFDIMNMRNILSNGTPTKYKNVGVSWSKKWNESQKESLQPKYIIYGHDASRGLNIKPYTKGLDSRCVYGGTLTALRWNKDGQKKYYSVECNQHVKS